MHFRSYSPPPPRRHPRLAIVADILCATALGVLLAAAAFHWLSCEGVC